MLRLRIKAPFAVFRRFSAGSYRPTAPLPAPTTAYGLLLNIAAIETRHDDGHSSMTVTAAGLPGCELALGLFRYPEVSVLFQQLHEYPVGRDLDKKIRQSGATALEDSHGAKYGIRPVSRELLSDLDMYICMRGNDDLEDRVRDGFREGAGFSPGGATRYGIPFLGDNNLMLSHLYEDHAAQPVHWMRRAVPGSSRGRTTQLPVWIDRADMTRTRSVLFYCDEFVSMSTPEDAWTPVGPH
ncbi:MAG: type I-MYXAN CRISPR-associated protein Cas5/Cmx5/DevS [Dehalococcoidia bacterium]